MHFKSHVLNNQLNFELRYNNPANIIDLDSEESITKDNQVNANIYQSES